MPRWHGSKWQCKRGISAEDKCSCTQELLHIYFLSTVCTIRWNCNMMLCSFKMIECSEPIKAFHAAIEVQDYDSARYSCNRTTCTSTSSTNSECSVETRTTTVTESIRYTTTQLVYPTITACSTTTINSQQQICNSTTDTHYPQRTNLLDMTTITPFFTPAPTSENSTTIHGVYIAVILVLLAIIITLMILMGYLFKRTTPQRGPVQTTHQSLTDMTASDYMEPVALRQLQTSTEPGQ